MQNLKHALKKELKTQTLTHVDKCARLLNSKVSLARALDIYHTLLLVEIGRASSNGTKQQKIDLLNEAYSELKREFNIT